MINKICVRTNCSKEFSTEVSTKIYCSTLCSLAEQQRRSRIYLLEKILNYFNNECALCGFDDPRALQIDHVNSGGRKEILNPSSSRLQYYRIVFRERESGKYQLLCANCNWIKRHTNSEK